jgi:exonuclease VII small subunit
MTKVNVEENIKKIMEAIDNMTREVLRLEGSLRVFREFHENGVKEVEIPVPDAEEEEVKETM